MLLLRLNERCLFAVDVLRDDATLLAVDSACSIVSSASVSLLLAASTLLVPAAALLLMRLLCCCALVLCQLWRASDTSIFNLCDM
jgi:hypothetical protein